ncbi:hypothetical protein J6590_075847, partial [Homalodisca vitripennis]
NTAEQTTLVLPVTELCNSPSPETLVNRLHLQQCRRTLLSKQPLSCLLPSSALHHQRLWLIGCIYNNTEEHC